MKQLISSFGASLHFLRSFFVSGSRALETLGFLVGPGDAVLKRCAEALRRSARPKIRSKSGAIDPRSRRSVRNAG